MRIYPIVMTLLVMMFAAYGSGCGSGGTTTTDLTTGGTEGNLSENEAIAFSEQLTSAIVGGMPTSNIAPSENAPLDSKSVQCNADYSSCTFYEQLSYRLTCTTGGRMELTGNITGTITNGSGMLSIDARETISDWSCITGFIVNGDPYISITGTFSYMNYAPSTQQSMHITGGFKWGTTAAESCQIYLAINFSNTGSGTIVGTVCGYDVDVDF